MLSVYQLKENFQKLLRPITNSLANTGITANQVTIFAFILSTLTGLAIYIFQVYLLIPIMLFIRMALNAIDGMIAREHNQKSNLGAILNELGDILSDIAMYIPFLYTCGVDMWLIMAFMLLSVITETVGIMAVQIGVTRRYDGPMGKSDRALAIALIAILVSFNFLSTEAINIIILVTIILLVFTIFNRIKNALKQSI